MVSNLQSGFGELFNGFLLEDKTNGKATKRSTKLKTSNLRVEMPYTYLIAWLVMNYPFLRTAANYHSMDKPFTMEMYECCSWRSHSMSVIRKTLQHHQNYRSAVAFPTFLMVETGRDLRIP